MDDFSSTDLLLDVAKVIDHSPERHRQSRWVADVGLEGPWDRGEPTLKDVVRAIKRGETTNLVETTCHTRACVCGWAVLLAPPDVVTTIDVESHLTASDDWVGFGAKLLGMDLDLAHLMFGGGNPREGLADALRDLAFIPPVRTLEDAFEAGIFNRYGVPPVGLDLQSAPRDLSGLHPEVIHGLVGLMVHPNTKVPPGYKMNSYWIEQDLEWVGDRLGMSSDQGGNS